MRQSISNFKKGKLTGQEQLAFLDYLQNSLANGFSLSTSLELMPILWPKRKRLLAGLSQRMTLGADLGQEMWQLGFSKTVATQVELAMQQGNLLDCLSQLATLNRLKNEQIKKLKTEMSYPVVLVVMMIALLVFMQTFVSSQFSSSNEHTGDVLLVGILGLGLLFLYYFTQVLTLLRKQDYHSLKKLAHYPIIGATVKVYVKYLLVYDIGLLVASGFSLQKMCQYAANQEKGSLQQYLGAKVNRQLAKGKSLQEIIKQELFLPDELVILLETGSTKGDLGNRCLLLGQTLFTDLTSKIEKLIVNVQPVCFILIGLCIIGMYLKLLLPMYAMMQQI
ncbi:type II secretion system F family protein [Lactobacillus sp. ESL0731]|uniref:type II secretion system F family protein n=1 Tax=unclassified Lactobacillus TaxID=2620435 RepID=UPI0023F9DA8B|nr:MULTISPECIES: type II secretion system F family protein [unclassified Lactobacillus]WEV51861.1 type II secretion system F family protein [Lactobacillus sp. ESL0700]WEV62991.1 type II secretion system F family protein [Lactobacillus sp. ESL0731]